MKIPYIILLILWILAGSWYAKKTWCGTTPKAKKPAAAGAAAAATKAKSDCDYSLMVKTDDFNVKSEDNFQFKINTSNLIIPSDDLTTALEKVAEYLDANPDRTLNVEGHYHSTETKPKSHDNQGAARAESIKRHLVSELGLSADQITLGSSNVTATCFLEKKTPLLKGASISVGAK